MGGSDTKFGGAAGVVEVVRRIVSNARFLLAGSLALVFVLTSSLDAKAMGTHNTGALIALRCPQDAPQPEELCQAMLNALSKAAPDHEIRAVNQNETFALGTNDREVTLHLDEVSKQLLRAHLEWRDGAKGAVQTGPRVDFGVVDTTLSPVLYSQFADGLVRATPELLADEN